MLNSARYTTCWWVIHKRTCWNFQQATWTFHPKVNTPCPFYLFILSSGGTGASFHPKCNSWSKNTTASPFRFAPYFKDQHVSLFRIEFSPSAPFPVSCHTWISKKIQKSWFWRLLWCGTSSWGCCSTHRSTMYVSQRLSWRLWAFLAASRPWPSHPRLLGSTGWAEALKLPTSSLIWQRVSKFHPILKRYSLTKKQHTGKKNEVVS